MNIEHKFTSEEPYKYIGSCKLIMAEHNYPYNIYINIKDLSMYHRAPPPGAIDFYPLKLGETPLNSEIEPIIVNQLVGSILELNLNTLPSITNSIILSLIKIFIQLPKTINSIIASYLKYENFESKTINFVWTDDLAPGNEFYSLVNLKPISAIIKITEKDGLPFSMHYLTIFKCLHDYVESYYDEEIFKKDDLLFMAIGRTPSTNYLFQTVGVVNLSISSSKNLFIYGNVFQFEWYLRDESIEFKNILVIDQTLKFELFNVYPEKTIELFSKGSISESHS